jgi:hypothetical protein
MKGRGTFLARSNENPYSHDNSMEDEHVGQLERTCCIHVL